MRTEVKAVSRFKISHVLRRISFEKQLYFLWRVVVLHGRKHNRQNGHIWVCFDLCRKTNVFFIKERRIVVDEIKLLNRNVEFKCPGMILNVDFGWIVFISYLCCHMQRMHPYLILLSSSDDELPLLIFDYWLKQTSTLSAVSNGVVKLLKHCVLVSTSWLNPNYLLKRIW